jgi:EAL domain-containing protein (putative c-di-GMP-specific phosphodiesterase class I)
VAEGIENTIQLESLRKLGCGYGEGYHLCRPADPSDIPAKLDSTAVVTRLRT